MQAPKPPGRDLSLSQLQTLHHLQMYESWVDWTAAQKKFRRFFPEVPRRMLICLVELDFIVNLRFFVPKSSMPAHHSGFDLVNRAHR
jgi:hypothetical protein